MFLILIFTIIGFLLGLVYVSKKRKIKPGNVLAAAFLGLVSTGILKILKDSFNNRNRRRFR